MAGSANLRAQAEDSARSVPDRRPSRSRSRSQPKPGARLVREWHGEPTRARADEGFAYAGETYPTLTNRPRHHRAHWSGPRFFGLVRQAHRTSATEATMAEQKGVETAYQQDALRHLYPQIL